MKIRMLTDMKDKGLEVEGLEGENLIWEKGDIYDIKDDASPNYLIKTIDGVKYGIPKDCPIKLFEVIESEEK